MTLAQLKREANAQSISAEMIYRYGEEIPERLRGKRYNYDGTITDNAIKGAAIIKYKIHHH